MAFDHRLLSRLTRRSRREQFFLLAAALAASLVLLYAGVVEPLREAKERLVVKIAVKEKELRELAELQRSYRSLQEAVEMTRGQAEDFSLLSFLEGAVNATVGREKMTAMNPASREMGEQFRENSVELRLSGLSLRETVELLYRIATAAPLRISRLHMKKRYSDPHTFDVTVVVAVLQERSEL